MAAAESGAGAGAVVVGGAGAAFGVGAALATVVVMCAKRPRSDAEWTIAITSTVVGSLGGGAAVLIKFGLLKPLVALEGAELFVALLALLGLVFACGLPAWAIVRAVFTWLARREGKDAGELLRDAAQDARSVISPPPAP